MHKRFLLLFLICLLSYTGWTQQELITLTRPNGRVELPFEYINNFIVVEVVFNKIFPLKFIFDTGAENTILTRREITDLLEVDYQREISIYGSDLATELTAYIAPGITINLGEDLKIASQAILVMEEDYFRFEEYAGIEVHGILGADILRRFVITIDYRRRRITFQDPRTFSPPRSKNFVDVSAEFSRHKPYLNFPANLVPRQNTNLKLLMDTGASLPLLLYTDADSLLQLPTNLIRTNIGHGLGGTIEGFVGRTASLEIGQQQMTNIITSFQDVSVDYQLDSTFLNNRSGVMGNVILRRFYIIIDYINEQVWLRPNRDFNKAFNFDRSGISVLANGVQLNRFTIVNIIEGSPAAEAGLQRGDEIRMLNGVPATLLGLESIGRILRKKVGKRIRMLIRRNDERFYAEFYLRDLI
ncbi:MAG: PDZ domain-containing protein [Bacteroidota bacterium]